MMGLTIKEFLACLVIGGAILGIFLALIFLWPKVLLILCLGLCALISSVAIGAMVLDLWDKET